MRGVAVLFVEDERNALDEVLDKRQIRKFAQIQCALSEILAVMECLS